MSGGNDLKAYLDRKRSEGVSEEGEELWRKLEDFHSKKLWHQLTQCVIQLVRHASFQNEGLVEFYHRFVADFEHKINPLSLVEIILNVVAQISDPEEAIDFLKGIKEKVKNDIEANVLCIISIGRLRLKLSTLKEVKILIEEAGSLLDSVTGITRVHARYYDLCSNYHKLRADHAAYYRDALRYLGCVDIGDISCDEKSDRAFSLGLAALLGDDIYNFGELLSHPVLSSLQGTEKEWLIKVLYAFNAGNIDEFVKLKYFWEQQPDLYTSQDKLMDKIRLLALMELVFSRHAHNRNILFSDVCNAAKVQSDQVELLVMKALSLGLIKGRIDEVQQEITMSWVQPRVLNLSQVNDLQARMGEWCNHIKTTINYIKDQVPDAVSAH